VIDECARQPRRDGGHRVCECPRNDHGHGSDRQEQQGGHEHDAAFDGLEHAVIGDGGPELYNVTQDPMELENLSGSPEHAAMEVYLGELLAQQRVLKRLRPLGSEVPGQ